MRIWSLHPQYLDSKGLVALWRESLLAQKVLQGQTQGYTNHPQLIRFKQEDEPLAFVGSYLEEVYEEASRRGYRFNEKKIVAKRTSCKIFVTSGQLEYEWRHLTLKLKKRAPSIHKKHLLVKNIQCHPLFELKRGDIEPWEVLS